MSVSDKPPSSWGDRLSNRLGVDDTLSTNRSADDDDNNGLSGPPTRHNSIATSSQEIVVSTTTSSSSSTTTSSSLCPPNSLSIASTTGQQPPLIPDVDLTYLDSEDKDLIVHISTREIFANKTVVIFCVPGAFTPHCSDIHLPSYEAEYDRLKALGVEEVYCISNNDPYVMDAWFTAQDIHKVKPLSDGNGSLADKMGYAVDLKALGLGIRSRRYSALICDNKIEQLFLDEDCATSPSMSLPDIMINYLKTSRLSPEQAVTHLGRTIVMLTTPDLAKGINQEVRRAIDKYGCSLHQINLPQYASSQIVKSISNRTPSEIPIFYTDGRLIGGLDDLLEFLPTMSSARKLILSDSVAFPSVDLDYGDHIINSVDLLKSRDVLVIGSPGAFTPICSHFHIMAYQELCREFFHHTDISDIYVLAVNDDCTFKAWFQAYGFQDLKFLPDHKAEITRQLGLELNLKCLGLDLRCQRFALVVRDGRIVEAFVEKDSLVRPTVTSAELLLNHLSPNTTPQEHIALFYRRGCPLKEQFATELMSLSLCFKEIEMSNAEFLRFLEAIGASNVDNAANTGAGDRICDIPFCLPPVVAVSGTMYRSLDALRDHLSLYMEATATVSTDSEILSSQAYPLAMLKKQQVSVESIGRSYTRHEECRRGDKIPSIVLHDHGENGSAEYSLDAMLRMDNAIIFSCPAAFDSLRSDPVVLRFEALWSTFEASGFHALYCVVPNDPFVANAWAQSLGLRHVKMIGDGNLDFIPRIIRNRVCKCQGHKTHDRDQFWIHLEGGIIKSISREDAVDPDLVLKRVDPFSLAPPTLILLSRFGNKLAVQARQLLNTNNIPFTEIEMPLGDAAYVHEALIGTRPPSDDLSGLQIWADGKQIGGLSDLCTWINQRNVKKEELARKRDEAAMEKLNDMNQSLQITLLKEGDTTEVVSLSKLFPLDSKIILFGATSAFEQAHSSTQLCRFEELYQHFQRAGATSIYCVCPNEAVVIREWFSQLEIRHVLPICDKALNVYNWVGAIARLKTPDVNGATTRPLGFVAMVVNGKVIFQEVCKEEADDGRWRPAENVLRALDPSIKVPDSVYLITKSNCRVCEATEALLKSHGVQFDVLDLPSFKSVKAMNGITRVGHAVPQVWLNGVCLGGYEACKRWLESQ